MTVSRSSLIARNTSLQTAGHVVGLGVAVGSAALLTRYLGVRAYGTFSLLGVLLTLPVTVLNGSLDTLTVRRLSADDRGGARFLSNVLGLKLAATGAFAAAAIAVTIVAPAPIALRLAVGIFGIAVVASGVQGTLLAVEQTRLDFRLPVVVDIGGRIVTLAGVALVVLSPHPGDPLARVALVVAVGAAATLLWLAVTVVARRGRITVRPAADRRSWAELGRNGVPLALISLLGLVNYRLDVVLLGALAGTHALGLYAIATRFMDAVLPLAAFFVAAAFPVLSATASHAAAQREGRARRAAEFLALASIPIMVGGCVFAPQLVHVVAGHAYAGAVTPLRLLLLSLPLSYLSTFLLYLLIAADRQRQVVPLMVASIALNIVLNVALVPFYSYDGPAIATLTTEIVGLAVLAVMVRRTLGISVLSVSLIRTVAAGAAMLGTALLLQPVDAVLACVVSVATYATASMTLRIVRPLDVKLLVGRAT